MPHNVHALARSWAITCAETGVGNRRCIWPLSGPSESPCRTAAIDRSCTTCVARDRSGSSVTADKPVRVTTTDRLRLPPVQRGLDGSHLTTFSLLYFVAQTPGWMGDLGVEDLHLTGDANACTPITPPLASSAPSACWPRRALLLLGPTIRCNAIRSCGSRLS